MATTDLGLSWYVCMTEIFFIWKGSRDHGNSRMICRDPYQCFLSEQAASYACVLALIKQSRTVRRILCLVVRT